MLLLLFISSALFHFTFALPTPTGFVLTHQNPGLAKQLVAHPAVTCPPCPTTSASFPQLQIPAPPAAPLTATSPCPAQNVQTVPNSVHPRVKRGCCCCCCKPCCCCCCTSNTGGEMPWGDFASFSGKPCCCCCGCALNICVKPSCCCKCCPTCCCCEF